MAKKDFYQLLTKEVGRIDKAKVNKRDEVVIEGFTQEASPKAIIGGKKYRVFNSNDYLGLRHHPKVKEAEHQASEKYGAGPGAVRFISGTLEIHKKLEKALAKFHGREAAMVVSSAFATNMAVMFALASGQSKDSLVNRNVLVVSDQLNHRSIIDGIRLAGLPKEQRMIFNHLDADDLGRILQENKDKFDRVMVVTDGIFSMLGEYQDLGKIHQVIDKYDSVYPRGVYLIVDDAHGIAAFGETGRGAEEVSSGKADVLVSTLGKGFGADGGYVVADKVVIDYLRESGATYIYSNNIAPGTAGAAAKSVEIVSGKEGQKLLANLRENIVYFKAKMKDLGFTMAADSIHPIQPILTADPVKTMDFKQMMYAKGILVTNINYPVVPKGKDEIRVQLSGAHTREDLDYFLKQAASVGKELGLF